MSPPSKACPSCATCRSMPDQQPITIVPARSSTPEPVGEPSTWWERYRSRAAAKLSPVALDVLEADARWIIDKAMPFTEAAPDVDAWPAAGVRTGLVIGSVQSGKTASMLAVASMALDQGVELVVLLAGTRVGLWLQTYERMLAQLDGTSLETAYTRDRQRLLVPQPEDVLDVERLGPRQYLKSSRATMAIRQRRPIIIVVPKLDEHLQHLSRMLKSVLPPTILEARDEPTTMLVLDDEADDASVLDSSTSEKITPRFIAALWSGDHHSSDSRHPKLLATYVAYTATPQANYLQETHNPLAPRDFNAALRVPGRTGAIEPRELTYLEPSGLHGYYTGGDLYYEELAALPVPFAASFNFPILEPGESEADFAERVATVRWAMISAAMRHYLVGGAARLLLDGRSLVSARSAVFGSPEELKAAVPRPHTMLFHPSVRKETHFASAAELAVWSRTVAGEEDGFELPEDEQGNPVLALDPKGLARRLAAEEDEWKSCLTAFEQTRLALSSYPRGDYPKLDHSRWPEVRSLLVAEIFGNVDIRVINSDPAADDRPRFEPIEDEAGFHAPHDIFTIFVAGNVLSRGLTVEGLVVSLFLRSAVEPAADTQMQMQRWFGYRGEHLPYCRVFLLADQLSLFRQYNSRDKALKSLVLARMAMSNDEAASSTLILEGEDFVATGKIDTRKVPLSPGASPQLRLIERVDPQKADSNVELARSALRQGAWAPIDPSREVGLIRNEPMDLEELADLLDGFRFTAHDPSLDHELSRRWVSLQHSAGLPEPLFRPPGLQATPYAIRPQACPYSIAAYLRLWSALTKGAFAPGLHATDKAELPWSQIDAKAAPRFYLAIRSGDGAATDPELARHGIGSIVRGIGPNDRLNTLWGSRGYGSSGYFGDQLIDYHYHKRTPVPRLEGGHAWRPRGHPGLALFHVVKDDRHGRDLVTIGLGMPHGGPDHIAALRR